MDHLSAQTHQEKQYDWVLGTGPGGTGSMIFDLGSGTDGANFSVPTAALTSFTFNFSNGDTIGLGGLNSIIVATNQWTAANGYLNTVAQLSDNLLPLPNYSFQFAPYSISSPNPNGSTAVDQGATGTLQNFGVWRQNPNPVALVPAPAGAWLVAPGLLLLGLFGFERRRRVVQTSA